MSAAERLDYLKAGPVGHKVAVMGGRFEVDLIDLSKTPVYWQEVAKSSEVRRCLWFYKESNDQRYLPYEEDYSKFLEVLLRFRFFDNIFIFAVKVLDTY